MAIENFIASVVTPSENYGIFCHFWGLRQRLLWYTDSRSIAMLKFEGFIFEEFTNFERVMRLSVYDDIQFLNCEIYLYSDFDPYPQKEDSLVYFIKCTIVDKDWQQDINALLNLYNGLKISFKPNNIFFNCWNGDNQLLDVLIHNNEDSELK